MKKLNYRPEIDGLRAIAVLAVIVFHSGVNQLSGGFVGVDIFYVISGYLITRILLTSLKNEAFTFSGFYIRRIKRILPASLFMVAITVVFGAFILSPDKYIELAQSAIYSNLFMANVWFMKHSGYFDQSTQVLPLVHMWSLSVEEQFYLIFPLVLLFAFRKNGLTSVKRLFISVLAISFLLSALLSSHFPHQAFYMLFTRAWELALGACLVIFPAAQTNNKTLSDAVSFTGVAAIIYGIIYITRNDAYPGYLALFPTLGTALIIYSLNNRNNIIKSILTTRPLLFTGKISYSAYLWHWPLIVYYRIYINEREFYAYEVFSLIVSSIFIGYLSWKYIEEPFRHKNYSPTKVYATAIYTTITVIALSASVLLSQGLPGRISESSAAITNNQLMWDWKCTQKVKLFPQINEEFCVIGTAWENAKIKGLVWGDSHSQHWAQLLHREALRSGISLIIAPRKCPPYLNSEYVSSYYPKFPRFTEKCTDRNKLAFNWLKNNGDASLVIMAAAWSGHVRMLYTDKQPINKSNSPLEEKDAATGAALSKIAFRKLLAKLPEKKILLLGDIPRPNKTLNECAFTEKLELFRKKCDDAMYRYLPSKTVLSWHKDSDHALSSMAKEFSNVTTILPDKSLCDDKYCQTYVNGELIYKDSNHIRRNLQETTVSVLSKKIGLQDYFSSLSKH